MLRQAISIFLMMLLGFILSNPTVAEDKRNIDEHSNLENDVKKQEIELLPDINRILAFEKQRERFPKAINLPGPEDVQKELKPVRVLSAGPVVYPAELRKAGQEGRVKVALLISENGDVVDTAVVESTNNNLNQVAILSMQSWKFSPMLLDNIPFKSVVIAPLEFKVDSRKK